MAKRPGFLRFATAKLLLNQANLAPPDFPVR